MRKTPRKQKKEKEKSASSSSFDFGRSLRVCVAQKGRRRKRKMNEEKKCKETVVVAVRRERALLGKRHGPVHSGHEEKKRTGEGDEHGAHTQLDPPFREAKGGSVRIVWLHPKADENEC